MFNAKKSKAYMAKNKDKVRARTPHRALATDGAPQPNPASVSIGCYRGKRGEGGG